MFRTVSGETLIDGYYKKVNEFGPYGEYGWVDNDTITYTVFSSDEETEGLSMRTPLYTQTLDVRSLDSAR